MAHRIDSKIVGYSVRASGDDTPAPSDDAPAQVAPPVGLHEGVKRPPFLAGFTYKLKVPHLEAALYITINNIVINHGTEAEQTRPFEIFINSKSMEHFQWVTGMTRILSAVFRKGGDVMFLADELMSVYDPNGGRWALPWYREPEADPNKRKYMPSVVAEIGDIIKYHLATTCTFGPYATPLRSVGVTGPWVGHDAAPEGKDATAGVVVGTDTVPGVPGGQYCSKCHADAVIQMDGCLTCTNCGDSKCG